MPIETFHISSESTHNKQQAGIKSICTEERGGGGIMMLQICVQISVVNGPVPSSYDTVLFERSMIIIFTNIYIKLSF